MKSHDLKFHKFKIMHAFQDGTFPVTHEYLKRIIHLAGTVLSFAFGAVVGFTLGAEVGNHWHQLYRLDTVGAQVKFNEWLQKRA